MPFQIRMSLFTFLAIFTYRFDYKDIFILFYLIFRYELTKEVVKIISKIAQVALGVFNLRLNWRTSST